MGGTTRTVVARFDDPAQAAVAVLGRHNPRLLERRAG